MRLKSVIMFAICFCFLSLVSASAVLEIQTLPNHELFITEIDAYSGSSNTPVIQPFSTFTGDEGKLVLDYTPKKSIFKLGFLLKSDSGSKTIGYTVFDELMHDGKKISITFLSNDVVVEESELIEEIEEVVEEEVVEEVVVETNVSEEIVPVIEDEIIAEVEDSENSSGIFKSALMQGSAILQENKPIVNIVSYFIVGLIVAFPLFLFVKKRKGKMANALGDLLPKQGRSNSDEDDFDKAESDLKKARERIEDLKGKKITEARQKLMEDERELMRLRKLGKD